VTRTHRETDVGGCGLIQLMLLRRLRETVGVAWLMVTGAVVITSVMLGVGCGTAGAVVESKSDADTGALYEVLLLPDTEAGWAGWCFVATGDVQGAHVGGSTMRR
jgi:hypothetical protein